MALPNGHIFVDSPSIRHSNSTWKVRGNYIGFERRIHVEIMKSIRSVYFDVDSTLYIEEISMNSPRRFFYVVSTPNRRNFYTRCFHSIYFVKFLLCVPILSYCGIMVSRCNFNNIDVIIGFGTIGTISFGNIATMQINRNNDKFYFLQSNINKDYNANIYNLKLYISS